MVRGGPANRAVKRAKIFALTKGFRGRRKNCYSLAVRAAHKALQYAYIGRRLKKRDMRKLWIQRINFAAQSHHIGYARFMNCMVKCNIQINRKVLSELAIHEPRTFAALAGIAKQRWKYGVLCYLHEDPFNLEKVSKFSPSHYERCEGPSTAKLYRKRDMDTGNVETPKSSTRSRKEKHDEDVVPLYQTRRVVDENTGKMVMETAV